MTMALNRAVLVLGTLTLESSPIPPIHHTPADVYLVFAAEDIGLLDGGVVTAHLVAAIHALAHSFDEQAVTARRWCQSIHTP
ncbi:hypothetical protein [Comamonas sp. NoAH]|uniref:hypothetical protein n=1 Tax=Comamonas halotolerans TaxID=3041496 RepID=UPI0024E09CC5|nr:hypothetical protein [Comamonas sp. NoAH]